MSRTLILSLVLASPLCGQVGAGHALVASRGTASMTELVEVDLLTGTVQALGGFAADDLAPLAVALDPINLDIVLALDLGGSTRFLRLSLSGAQVVAERVLGDVLGTASHLTIGARGDVFAAFGGPDGKLIRLPRHGGAPLFQLPMPHVSAMTDFGLATENALVVQSATGADPSVSWVELNELEIIQGPDVVTGPAPSPVTGVFDYPTGVARQLLSRDDGAIALHLPGSGLPSQVLPIDPALPAGGAVAMRGTLDHRPIVLGGVADPFLKTFDLFAAGTPRWRVLAGPLPGDPVDYAVAPDGFGVVQNFGVSCGAPGLLLFGHAGGAPVLGNASFRLQLLGGVASNPVILALGFDDPPPVALPSGCELLVSPDHVLLLDTDPFGMAELALPVPNHLSLVDLFVYAQWFQAPGLPFSTSEAASIRIGH